MSWLATWFIFELIGVGAVPDLSETQAFKVFSTSLLLSKSWMVQFLKTKNKTILLVCSIR